MFGIIMLLARLCPPNTDLCLFLLLLLLFGFELCVCTFCFIHKVSVYDHVLI